MTKVQNLSSIDPALLEVAICASDLYLFSNLEGHVLFLNKAGKQVLGLGGKETPECISDIFDEKDSFVKEVMAGRARIEGRSSHLLKIKHFGENKFFASRINCIYLGQDIFLVIAKDLSRELALRSRNKELLRKLEGQALALKNSDKKYREAQEVAKLGSWHFDIQSQAISWSDQMYEIFPEDKTMGEPAFEKHRATIYHEDVDLWESNVAHCVATGLPYEMCFRVVHPSNRIVWVKALGRGELDKAGNVVALFGTCQDITEEKRNQDLQELVLGKLKIGIWQWNIPKDELVWGKGMSSLYGLKGQDRKTSFEKWQELLSEDCREEVMEKVMEAIQSQDRFDFRFKIVRVDGKIRHIRSRGNVERDARGRPFFAYGINYDITNEILLNEKLEEERAKMIQASKLATLGEMAAGIAHEINNPLTIISGSASIIEYHKERPEKISQSVQKITNSVDRISRIIQGLRKFSRQSDGLERQKVSAYSILSESVELTASSAKMRRTPVIIEDFEDFDFDCDEVQIQQVFVNLITNALDAQNKFERPWIKLTAYLRGSRAVFEIRDAGKGIPSKTANRLFNPFFTTKDVGKGTGLGLSISKGIAQDHDGDLEYSLKNGNTCFTLTIKRSVGALKKDSAA